MKTITSIALFLTAVMATPALNARIDDKVCNSDNGLHGTALCCDEDPFDGHFIFCQGFGEPQNRDDFYYLCASNQRNAACCVKPEEGVYDFDCVRP